MSEQEIQNIVQTNTALRNENAILKEQLALLQEQYDWLKKQVFGRKKRTDFCHYGRRYAAFFGSGRKEQAVSSVEETASVPAHQRKKKRTHEEWMSSLPVEEVRHEEEHPVCERCGSEMKEIGEEKELHRKKKNDKIKASINRGVKRC